jgi:hypothetical protein
MKAMSQPSTPAQKFFTTMQEATRKEVERSFGVLLSRWHILETGTYSIRGSSFLLKRLSILGSSEGM